MIMRRNGKFYLAASGNLIVELPSYMKTDRIIYLLKARPLAFFFLGCLSTLGVWFLTFPARASDPCTLPYKNTFNLPHSSNSDRTETKKELPRRLFHLFIVDLRDRKYEKEFPRPKPIRKLSLHSCPLGLTMVL